MKSIAIILVLASLSACSGMGMGSSGASGTNGYGESGITTSGNPYNDPANIYFGS